MMQQIGPEHKAQLMKYSEIRKRLMGTYRPVQKAQDPKVEPEWKMSAIRFDAHVKDYRMFGAKNHNLKGLTILEYIKNRCDEEGYIYAEMMNGSQMHHIVIQRRKIWVELSARGMSAAKIAKIFRKDHTTVLAGMQKEDPENRAGRISIKKLDLTQEEERRIVEHYKEVGITSHTAKYFKMSSTTLIKILERNGINKNMASTTIDRFDIFKPEQGKLIRSLYEAGLSYRNICKEIGLSSETIRSYIKAKGIVKGAAIATQEAA